ncbi:MAG: hypothetical protein SH807_04100 [Blastochloris sp.]|nr:hypothetical protein [Blastochloris sp.]
MASKFDRKLQHCNVPPRLTAAASSDPAGAGPTRINRRCPALTRSLPLVSPFGLPAAVSPSRALVPPWSWACRRPANGCSAFTERGG